MDSCGMCSSKSAKYICPRCTMRSCSLECCKNHKKSFDCSGVRDKTAYVKLTEFTDSHLLNDYRFLEDIERTTDSVKKDATSKKNVSKNNYLRKLVASSEKRCITLKISPFFTTKRRKNSTVYLKKTDKILWHIHWSFPKMGIEFYTPRIDEGRSMEDIMTVEVTKRLAGMNIPQEQIGDLLPYLKIASHKDKGKFHRLNLQMALGDNLKKKTLLEYPEVVLASQEDSKNFVVVEE